VPLGSALSIRGKKIGRKAAFPRNFPKGKWGAGNGLVLNNNVSSSGGEEFKGLGKKTGYTWKATTGFLTNVKGREGKKDLEHQGPTQGWGK